MRYFFFSLMTVCFLLEAKVGPFDLEAESVIVMNADTGAILYEKNARLLQYPASTTKVGTIAYILNVQGHKLGIKLVAEQDDIGWVSEEAKRRANYTLPAYWLVPGGTHMNIMEGEELSFEALLNGMMLVSANDAANVLARYVGGTIPNFMKLLNAYLKEIGCENTTFYNPHGLHHPKHQTTAYDLAIMAKEGLKNPIFREIVSKVRYTRPVTNKQEASTLLQGNFLLRKSKAYYPKAIGVKTGYTYLAGQNLVAAAQDGDRTLIAVLLGSKSKKQSCKEATKLFEAMFNEPKMRRILMKAGPQREALKVEGSSPISTYLKRDIKVDYYPAEGFGLKCMIAWDAVELPVKRGERVGEVHVINEQGEIVQKEPLLARNTVTRGWLFQIQDFFSRDKAKSGSSPFIKSIGILSVAAFLGFFIYQLKKR